MGFCEATFMPDKDTAANLVQHQHALPYRQRSASKTVSKLRDPLILCDGKSFSDYTRLLQDFGVLFHEGPQPVFGHVGDQVVEHAALAEQGMGAGLDSVGLEIMPRLSPAAPSRVSRTTAKALSSSSAA